jgi:hypothetical protein
LSAKIYPETNAGKWERALATSRSTMLETQGDEQENPRELLPERILCSPKNSHEILAWLSIVICMLPCGWRGWKLSRTRSGPEACPCLWILDACRLVHGLQMDSTTFWTHQLSLALQSHPSIVVTWILSVREPIFLTISTIVSHQQIRSR